MTGNLNAPQRWLGFDKNSVCVKIWPVLSAVKGFSDKDNLAESTVNRLELALHDESGHLLGGLPAF